MRIIFSDLDGTLLDHAANDWSPARPALSALHLAAIPVVFVSSKTRAEMELWRDQMANRHPFIFENGAAIAVPHDYFGGPIPGARNLGGYQMLLFGTPAGELQSVLLHAARATGVEVLTLDRMTDAEILRRTALRPEQVPLIRRREFGVPFVLPDGVDPLPLRRAIESAGKRYTRGGRFHHILGANDKRKAVQALVALYRQKYGAVTTLGLGDGPNDLGFLLDMNTAVVVTGRQSDKLASDLPHAYLTRQSGPAGWNEAIQHLVLSPESSAGTPPASPPAPRDSEAAP